MPATNSRTGASRASTRKSSAATGTETTPRKRRQRNRRKQGSNEAVRAQCPNGEHHFAKVYKTEGRTRYCKCDTCGAEGTDGKKGTFKLIGPTKAEFDKQQEKAAAHCPKNPRHNAVEYTRDIRRAIRKCKCDTCGEFWTEPIEVTQAA